MMSAKQSSFVLNTATSLLLVFVVWLVSHGIFVANQENSDTFQREKQVLRIPSLSNVIRTSIEKQHETHPSSTRLDRRSLKKSKGKGTTMMKKETSGKTAKSKMGSKGSKGILDECASVDDFTRYSKGSKGKGRELARSTIQELESRLLKMGMDTDSVFGGKGMMKGKNSKSMKSGGMKSKGKGRKSRGKGRTEMPTLFCSQAPSVQPTISQQPTVSIAPTVVPTVSPSDVPTQSPSSSPSNTPTSSPTDVPTNIPTSAPSDVPTSTPSVSPSATPTATPTTPPSVSPTVAPSASPTRSPAPSTSAPAEFVLIELIDRAECRVSADGQCIFSDEGDETNDYPAPSECTFQLTGTAQLEVRYFALSTEGTPDTLSIGGIEFTGRSGPDGRIVGGGVNITFVTDNDPFSVDIGFQICIALV